MGENNIIIRSAKKEDCRQVRALIQELATYQEMPEGPKITASVLEQDGFGTNEPYFFSTVAVDSNTNDVVGYTIFYHLYDCFEGKYVYLEDICVTESYRKKGVGAKLFESVVKAGVETNCSSMRWDVLKWNPARQFYDKYGASNLTETKGVLFYRYYKPE